jgi:hypothetical protein
MPSPVLIADFHTVSGKVFRTSDHPVATGGSQDIYTGEWTGQEVRRAELLPVFVELCLGSACLSTEPDPCCAGGEIRLLFKKR